MSDNGQPGGGYRYGQIPPEQGLQNRGFPEQSLQNQEPQYGGYPVQSQGPGGPVTKSFETKHPAKISEPPRKPPNPWKGATLVLLVIALVLLATTYIAFTHANNAASQVATPTSLALHTTPTITNPTPTSAATQAATDTATEQATLPAESSTPEADETIKENLTLTCGGCNDPVLVTINTIQIDNANRHMVWDATLKDVSGANLEYNISEYDVQASGSQNKVAATFSPQQNWGLVANTPLDLQAIFTFVPSHNLVYTFTAVLSTNTGVTVTFDPVKITL